jgi:mannosyltransferase
LIEKTGSSSTKRSTAVVLLLLVAGASCLRLYGLGIQSLWNDELSSWSRSSYPTLSEVIDHGVKPDVHPPGFFILLYYIERWIGDSEKALRFPSAIAGSLSVFAIFLIGRQLYSASEGLIAAALLSVLWSPIEISQEARSYSLAILFAMLSMYFWIEWNRSLQKGHKCRLSTWVAYLLSATICAYLHYYALLLILLQGIVSVLAYARDWKKLWIVLICYLIIGCAYAPWIPAMFSQRMNTGGDWIPSPRLDFLFSYFRTLFNKSTFLLFFGGLLWILSILITHFQGKGKEKTNVLWSASSAWILSLWLFLPFLSAYMISLLWRPILTQRYLLIAAPAVYLLVARSIAVLACDAKKQAFLTAICCSMLLYHLIFYKHYYTTVRKEQFREAAQMVVTKGRKNPGCVVVAWVWNANYLHYYFRKAGSDQRVALLAGEEQDIPLFENFIYQNQPDCFWYVSAHLKPDVKFKNFLLKHYYLVSKKNFRRASVALYSIHPRRTRLRPEKRKWAV